MTFKKKDLGEDGRTKLENIEFRCPLCRTTWEGPPDIVEDYPEFDFHPYRYFANCHKCGTKTPQAQRERMLLRAWAYGKPGPKTEAGRRQMAANLKARDDPEMPRRARFNALKHGAYAQTATYFPSRPGGYPHCKGCTYLADDDCVAGPSPCKRRTELFFRHHLAFETANPDVLRPLNSTLQANVRGIIDDIILAVINDGVALRNPKIEQNRDGGWSTATYIDPDSGEKKTIMEIAAHPLLRQLGDMLAKNSLTMADMGMTPKAKEEQDDSMGRLAHEERQQEAALEFQARQTQALEGLALLIERSRQRTANDPILLEHQQGDGDDAG